MAEYSEVENNQNVDSEEDEVEVDAEPPDGQRDVMAQESFLMQNEDLEKHKIEIIAGDK